MTEERSRADAVAGGDDRPAEEAARKRRGGRDSGMELLRIIAMLGIILFHHFGNRAPNAFVSLPESFTAESYFYDFVNNSTAALEPKTLILDFLYGHVGDGSVLLFMMITGYFLYGREMGLAKRAEAAKKILLITAYWGVALAVITGLLVHYFYPFSADPTCKPVFNLFTWFSGPNMWYFQAYGVFILLILPIIKHFEPKIDRRTHKALIITFVALCFLDYADFLPGFWISFQLLEFIMCYFVGGYIAKYRVRVSTAGLIAAFGIYVCLYFVYEYFWRIDMRKMFQPAEYSYVDVRSPFVSCLIYAVFMFLLFSKIHFRSRIVNAVAATTPGIYLFHFNLLGTAYVLAASAWWKDWSLDGFFRFVFIDTIVLFAIGAVIDGIRVALFALVKRIGRKR